MIALGVAACAALLGTAALAWDAARRWLAVSLEKERARVAEADYARLEVRIADAEKLAKEALAITRDMSFAATGRRGR